MRNLIFFFLLMSVIELSCSSSKLIIRPNNLINDEKIYLLYTDDHEAPKDWKGVMQIEYQSIYAVLHKQYDRLKPEKGIRLSTIGYKSDPVWNKQGNLIAYLSFISTDTIHVWDRGQIEVKDVTTGVLNIYDNLDACWCGLSWDESGDYLVFGEATNEISMLNVKNGSKKVLLKTKSRPEQISISPNGKHVIYMTRDGAHSNDADGWRLNLYTIGENEVKKVGLLNDKFGVHGDFWWKWDSSVVLLSGFFLEENNDRSYNWWTYNLTTQELNPSKVDISKFYQQSIRYWKAGKIYPWLL